MKVTLEKVENNTAYVNIEADLEEFDKALNHSFRKNARRFFVPGFRKGKAPRKMVELHYGPEVLYEDAAEILLPKAYEQAVEENNLEPVDQPKFDIDQIEKGKPFIANFEVTVKPHVTLTDYKGLEVEKLVYNVTDEEVEKELDALQDKNARLIAVEDSPAETGNTAVIDFVGSLEGVPFDGGSGENYPLVLGSDTFIPGFEDQVVGMKPQDERDIVVTFPEDYKVEDLAGKEVNFKVILKELKKKELLPLDDEFAKDVSEFDTLEELKDDLRIKLEQRAKSMEEGALKAALINKLSEQVDLDIPKVMVDRETENLMMEFARNLQYSGFNLSSYLQATGTTPEDFKARFEDNARENVKATIILNEVAELEEIAVSDEELDQKLRENAEQANKTLEDFKEGLNPHHIQNIEDSLLTQKIFDFLIENAVLTEKQAEAAQEK